jgi:hypothetical protein
MKRKAGFILQSIGDETYAVAVTPETAAIGSMIRLNPTGAFLFAYLEEERTEEDCVAALTEHYEIDPAVAAADVRRFLTGLREAKLLA